MLGEAAHDLLARLEELVAVAGALVGREKRRLRVGTALLEEEVGRRLEDPGVVVLRGAIAGEGEDGHVRSVLAEGVERSHADAVIGVVLGEGRDEANGLVSDRARGDRAHLGEGARRGHAGGRVPLRETLRRFEGLGGSAGGEGD